MPAAAAGLLEDFVDQHALTFVHAELARQFHRERLDTDAQPASVTRLESAVAESPAWPYWRNRKADSLSEVDDGRIDADDFAPQIEERAARVAGIDGGVRLNEVFVAREIDVLTADAADDSQRNRSIEANGFPRRGPIDRRGPSTNRRTLRWREDERRSPEDG